jgi:hypothetical protein
MRMRYHKDRKEYLNFIREMDSKLFSNEEASLPAFPSIVVGDSSYQNKSPVRNTLINLNDGTDFQISSEMRHKLLKHLEQLDTVLDAQRQEISTFHKEVASAYLEFQAEQEKEKAQEQQIKVKKEADTVAKSTSIKKESKSSTSLSDRSNASGEDSDDKRQNSKKEKKSRYDSEHDESDDRDERRNKQENSANDDSNSDSDENNRRNRHSLPSGTFRRGRISSQFGAASQVCTQHDTSSK